MYQHILVPVEIKEAKAYDDALKVAAELLGQGGKITLLHVIEPIPTYVSASIPPELSMQSNTEAKKLLQAMAGDLRTENAAVVYGSAGRSIVEWAVKNDADCIVIKSHKPEFSDWFLGSTAAWVVRHAQTNVHVLR